MWHTDHEKDVIKTKLANENGFKLLRISSELSDDVKFNKINKFINDEMQIKNPHWGIV